MKAEILTVGTELLMGQTVNTNAAEIAQMLAEVGVGVYYQTIVGDNPERLEQAVQTAVSRADLLVACGGLGPTEDDLTRETVAQVLETPLKRDEGWARRLVELFERRGRPFGKNNLRQAMVPEGGILLENPNGTAPGIYLERGDLTVVLLPGPPHEMRALMREEVMPRLALGLAGTQRSAVLVSKMLRVVGVGESRAVELLEPILASQSNPTIAPLAKLAEVHLRITASAPDAAEAERLIAQASEQIRAKLGDAVYGEDETTLEQAVGELLKQQKQTLTVAESCTGGLLSHRLTNVPGSSGYYVGGVVAYSNAFKIAALSVDDEVIEREGAVSDTVATGMARGARSASGADIAVAITGIAGPGGGSAEKPVGLTFIALADGSGEVCRRYEFWGGREQIKARAAQSALELLRRHLLNRGE